MKSHLSSEQFDEVLSGQPSQETSRHLAACAQCAEEVGSMRVALGNFRSATVASAEHHWHFASASTPRRMPRMAWGLAAAALFVSIAAPLAVHQFNRAPAVQQNVPPAVMISDDALLNSVESDLSTHVAEPLRPLTNTSTATTNSNTNPRKN